MTCDLLVGAFFRSVAYLHVELPRLQVEPFSPAEHQRSTPSNRENSAPWHRLTQPTARPSISGKATHSLIGFLVIFTFVAQLPHPGEEADVLFGARGRTSTLCVYDNYFFDTQFR